MRCVVFIFALGINKCRPRKSFLLLFSPITFENGELRLKSMTAEVGALHEAMAGLHGEMGAVQRELDIAKSSQDKMATGERRGEEKSLQASHDRNSNFPPRGRIWASVLDPSLKTLPNPNVWRTSELAGCLGCAWHVWPCLCAIDQPFDDILCYRTVPQTLPGRRVGTENHRRNAQRPLQGRKMRRKG